MTLTAYDIVKKGLTVSEFNSFHLLGSCNLYFVEFLDGNFVFVELLHLTRSSAIQRFAWIRKWNQGRLEEAINRCTAASAKCFFSLHFLLILLNFLWCLCGLKCASSVSWSLNKLQLLPDVEWSFSGLTFVSVWSVEWPLCPRLLTFCMHVTYLLALYWFYFLELMAFCC